MERLNELIDDYDKAKREYRTAREKVNWDRSVSDYTVRHAESALATYILGMRQYLRLDLPEGTADKDLVTPGFISKSITYFGQSCFLSCDANCTKAWGMNNRPKLYRTVSGQYEALTFEQSCDEALVPDGDDYCYLADGELGIAPIDPGTYEGDQAKPRNSTQRLNKWCARECERSSIDDPGDKVELKDLSKRFYNMAPHTRD